jgi:hypothetical protein
MLRRMRPQRLKGQFRALTDKIISTMFMIKFIGARSTRSSLYWYARLFNWGCFVQSEAFLKDAKHATLPKILPGDQTIYPQLSTLSG